MPDGRMTWQLNDKIKLKDHDCETIVIQYKFKPGITSEGIQFEGTDRIAYLPHN